MAHNPCLRFVMITDCCQSFQWITCPVLVMTIPLYIPKIPLTSLMSDETLLLIIPLRLPINPDSAVENGYGGSCAFTGTRLLGELAPADGG